ncbi:MAG: ferredoxin, partial [Myxococcota bacterium]
MKVVVDYDLCESNALCMDCAPEVFRVEEDDTLTVLIEAVPDELRTKVEEAVRLCP